jgi:catechol 2,3-dioxygenase-like lactoylglutathione lyase family enzyme
VSTVPFEVRTLDHVNVTAPEALESEVVSWYREVLGLEQLDKPSGTRRERGGWFKAGDRELHISIDPPGPSPQAHFALTVDDYAAALEHLRAAGCHIEPAGPIPGRQRFFIRDPAGNRLEIIGFD